MLVTVITPTFNRARFLPETIESVLGQDYPHIEYIVLDDGSEDNTEIVISPYLSRLTYVKHKNMGESKTVNKGYHLAKGEIILVVNSDDPLWNLSAISKSMAYFQNDNEVILVYPDWVEINNQGAVVKEMRLPLYHIQDMLMDFNVSLGPGVFIRKSTFINSIYRNERLKYTGDLDIAFRIIRGNQKIIHIPEFLASHRTHEDSASIKSQCNVMAKEIFRLCKKSFVKTNQLPRICLQERRKIFALAAYSAFMVCGRHSLVKIKWLLLALIYNKFNNDIYYTNGKFIKLDLREKLADIIRLRN